MIWSFYCLSLLKLQIIQKSNKIKIKRINKIVVFDVYLADVKSNMVARGRIELPTQGFSVLCSTD